MNQAMGIAKKKPSTKSTPPVRVSLCENLPVLQEALTRLPALDDLAAVHALDVAMPQDILALYAAVEDAQHRLGQMQEVLKAKLLAHRKGTGGFEPGAYMALFPSSSKVSPKWKDEAITLATEVSNLKGVPFVESRFLDAVKVKYPLSESISLQVVSSTRLTEG